MPQFSKPNTHFLAPTKDGGLAVYQHYTQGANVITMRMATATEVKPGVWERNNHADGPARFPRRYLTEHAALSGMVAKSLRDTVFELGQDAVIAAHDAYNLKRTPVEVENYRFQMKVRDEERARRATA